MRIAIVSSPRSGNTWLRSILRDSWGLQEVAVHNYLDAESIPEKCVLQVHWYREPNFQNFLARHGFQVITMARHPLDVLISVLHFVRYEPETAKWLGGNCELPQSLAGQSPTSDGFLEYALSFGCENLLCVTYQWWHDPSAITVRYEDLVATPTREAIRLSEQLGGPAERIPNALADNSLEVFKALPNRHGWQGKPGVWRDLIPFECAVQIFARHQHVFDKLGYTIDSTPLTQDTAAENWESMLR